MIRVAILGATGYSALELIKLLLRHPQVEITALTTRQAEPRPVGAVHPSLAGRLDLPVENLPLDAVADRADAVFCCLPHGASAAAVAELVPRGKKVIDLSADYRLSDAAEYAKWYGLEHADPDRLTEAVYGLPELYRDEIKTALLVANPGCYPTSAILALAPLLNAGVISSEGIIVDSKSGVSGAESGSRASAIRPTAAAKRSGARRKTSGGCASSSSTTASVPGPVISVAPAALSRVSAHGRSQGPSTRAGGEARGS